jgi:hypothetical protein
MTLLQQRGRNYGERLDAGGDGRHRVGEELVGMRAGEFLARGVRGGELRGVGGDAGEDAGAVKRIV